MPKAISFSQHAFDSMRRRGAVEVEVEQAINESAWSKAKQGRFECIKDFPYNEYWNGKLYKTKRVVPIFKEENAIVVVITVYVFYF